MILKSILLVIPALLVAHRLCAEPVKFGNWILFEERDDVNNRSYYILANIGSEKGPNGETPFLIAGCKGIGINGLERAGITEMKYRFEHQEAPKIAYNLTPEAKGFFWVDLDDVSGLIPALSEFQREGMLFVAIDTPDRESFRLKFNMDGFHDGMRALLETC